MTDRTQFDAALQERLVRYARIDSQSDEFSTTTPSTECQWDMLRELETELRAMNARDVRLTPTGFVIATIPATVTDHAMPVVAFFAHVDTAPQFNATNVKPVVYPNWDGSDIHYPDNPSLLLSPKVDPYLASKVGDDIITASGLTLLGADDKSGVAIVMTLAEYLLAHPEVKHGDVRVCFTPDEETGTGVRQLNLDDVRADVAYTLDGGCRGELTYESFSADKAEVCIDGVSIHPGTATGKMVNAMQLAAKLLTMLPQSTRTPETTSGREGFIHPTTISGGAASVRMGFILRDFEREALHEHGHLLQMICDTVQASEPRAKVTCTITKQYRNMRYWLEDDMRPVQLAEEAMRALAIEPVFKPIRGGTDGSQLTEHGLPTPNLFCGSNSVHGPLEWSSVQDMGWATEVCVKLAELWGEQSLN